MIVSLKLVNYIPLLSSDITEVTLDIKGMINLFIGRSGVGKSSILKELHAMPPENGNYVKGRKLIKIVEHGKLYVLDSFTDVGNGHSFTIDGGPNLNTGGTYSAQKELVFRHFGKMNSDLVKVLSGIKIKDRLSAMDTNRRKDIIMQVYPNDTSEALEIFYKLKSERNELKATIKNQITRYTAENAKLTQITACGTEELENRVKQVDENITKSLLLRGELANAKINPNTKTKLERFNFLTDKLLVNNLSRVTFSREELVDALELTNELFNAQQDQMNVLKGVIAEHSSFLDGLEDLLKDPDSFREQAKHISEDMDRTNTTLENYQQLLLRADVFSDKDTPLDGLEYVVEAFKSFLNAVVLASTPELNSGAYRKLLLDDEQLGNVIRNRTSQLEDLKHKLAHYLSMDSVECPDCNSKFKVGVTKQDIDKLKTDIQAATEYLETLKVKKDNLVSKISNDAEWFSSMNNLYEFVRNNPTVKCLPEFIKVYNIGKSPCNTLCNLLSAYVKSQELFKYRATLVAEQKIVESRLEIINKDGLADTANYIHNMEAELAKATNLTSFYKAKANNLTVEITSIDNYQKELEELKLIRGELFEELSSQANVKLRGILDEQISELMKNKKDIMMELISATSLTAVVESISSDISLKKRRLVIVETWMNSICPNKGLIGKLMSDFINSICGNVNAVLKSFWNTPLYIKPCSKENGDLNYKFPVVTGDSKPTPDVSDCSGGETDAVDWAFRFTLLNYVNCSFPLILDEVGITFDEIKRGRFLDFLKDYTLGKQPRQLFMASHYFSQYGVFKNPNVIGLKHEGLTLPGEANANTVIV